MESARGPIDPFAWFVPLSARGDRRRTAHAQAVARALLAISAMTVLLSV